MSFSTPRISPHYFQYLGWQLGSLAIAALVFLPLVTLVWLSFGAESDVWQHLTTTVLPDYILGSLELMLGVALLATFVGVGCAWLVTQYNFPAVRFFNLALLLPLAMPAYITAYSYTGLFDGAGPLQVWLRDAFGLTYGQYWFPQIRSVGGAIFVLSFVLYPYIYLLARAAFLDQSTNLTDASRLLGCSRLQAFRKISLPIARPAIIAGLALVLMETLADFGTVSYFGVSTFTTGIFRTWYGLDSIHSAAQLSLALLAFVIVLLLLEKHSRQRAKYYMHRSNQQARKKQLTGLLAFGAVTLAAIPLLLGFIVPTTQLFYWAAQNMSQLFSKSFWLLLEHTFVVAGVTSIIAVVLAFMLAYSYRLTQHRLVKMARQIAELGYAVPGMVIAVGILVPLAGVDKAINHWMQNHFGISTGLLISGTIAALVLAYLVRFLAVSLKTVESGLNAIRPTLDQSARSLGASPAQVMRRIHIPLMRNSLLTALLIVFVDVMKELPATLVLRPFNYNTLAVRAYELASDERLADAALPSLAIVLAGLIPVILLTKAMKQSA